MPKQLKSKTIIGIIIAAVSIIVGQIARQTGAPITSEETTDLLNQMTDLLVNISDTIGAIVGLYIAYRGRMNPDIKPLAEKPK